MNSKTLIAFAALTILPASFAFAGASSADPVTLFCADSTYWFVIPASPPPEFTSSISVKEDGSSRNERVYVTTREDLVSVSFTQSSCLVTLRQIGKSEWQREVSCGGQAYKPVTCIYRWY